MPVETAAPDASSLGAAASRRSGYITAMARPAKLDDGAVTAWIGKHAGWERVGEDAIAKRFSFPDFGAALGFVVRVGCLAEKKDHHPDVELGWGRARVLWSTHDAGGVTQLDLDAAEAVDGLAG
jgi:4a-hydroxytetrahydrobiopterin dehydratase